MSEFNATRQLKHLKCELERKYYHLYDVEDPVNTIVQNAIEVLHKQRVAILDNDNKIKELEEKLENLDRFIKENYGPYKRDNYDDVVDIAIITMEKLERNNEILKERGHLARTTRYALTPEVEGEDNMKSFLVYFKTGSCLLAKGEEVVYDEVENSYKIGNDIYSRENVMAIVEN